MLHPRVYCLYRVYGQQDFELVDVFHNLQMARRESERLYQFDKDNPSDNYECSYCVITYQKEREHENIY